jgi:hypothetical protein
MKVAELKEALEARGLDATGKKDELVQRLEEALDDEALGGGNNAAPAPAPVPVPAPAPVPATPAQAVAPAPVLPQAAPVAAAPAAAPASAGADDLQAKAKLVGVTNLSAEERKKLREAKFGVVQKDEPKPAPAAKAAAPAGAAAKSGGKVAALTTEQQTKAAERAARFGVPVAAAAAAPVGGRKGKRDAAAAEITHAAPVEVKKAVLSEAEQAKAAARAARFATKA